MTNTQPKNLEEWNRSLEGYLHAHHCWKIIDFHLRASVDSEGVVSFYIHPQDKDGKTADFLVELNSLHRTDKPPA